VRSGDKKTLTLGIITDNASRTGRLRIQNLNNGKYLTSGSAWQASATDCLTRANVSWGTQSITFTVEGLSLSKTDTVTLRVTCYCNGSGAGWAGFDEVYMWTWPDFSSIHGFLNLKAITAVELHSSTNNFSGNDTTRATFTIPQNMKLTPAMYVTFTQAGDRYWRLKFVGTPPEPLYGGQWILSQKWTPTQFYTGGPIAGPMDQIDLGFAWPQIRSGVRSFLIGDSALRACGVHIIWRSQAAYDEGRDEILGRSALGHHPLVIVPESTQDFCLYGRFDPYVQITQRYLNVWDAAVVRVIELPNPTVTNVL
jgi:hypothetical protein